MSDQHPSTVESFAPSSLDAARTEAYRLTESGDLEGAASLWQEFAKQAGAAGDETGETTARCNRARLIVELGRGLEVVGLLREVVSEHASSGLGFLAALALARHYEMVKDHRKALFYGAIARDRAAALDNTDFRCASLNHVGNALLGLFRLEEAEASYRDALALAVGPRQRGFAAFVGNLGYCETLRGRHEAARMLLVVGLRLARRQGDRYEETQRHLDLAHLYLEMRRLGAAARHAAVGLRRALDQRAGSEQEKNALYLLGEVALLAGDSAGARRHFERLQTTFFPGQSFLVSFLESVDVRPLINLHA